MDKHNLAEVVNVSASKVSGGVALDPQGDEMADLLAFDENRSRGPKGVAAAVKPRSGESARTRRLSLSGPGCLHGLLGSTMFLSHSNTEKFMKKIQSLTFALSLLALPCSMYAQEQMSSVTTTETAGTISELGQDTIVVRSGNSSPMRYSSTQSTTYVDETGTPVSAETVKSGSPVTVYYTRDGNRLVADKVVVRKQPPPPKPPSTPKTDPHDHNNRKQISSIGCTWRAVI